MTSSEPSTESPLTESIVEMGRLGGLTDAVFAVALTLLVLELRLPEGVSAAEVPARLLDLAPQALIYLISFVIIGGAWGSHQRMFGQIIRGDGPLVWLSLLSLLFVTLVPASASLLGRFPDSLTAVVCFGLDILFVQLSAGLLWRHASRNGLIRPGLDPRVVQGIGRRLSLGAIMIAVAIPLALVTVLLVYVVWIALFVMLFTTDWLSWQQASRTERAVIPLDGAQRARVSIEHIGGRLNIQPGPKDAGLVRGLFGGGIKWERSLIDGRLEIKMAPSTKAGFLSWRFPWAWSRSNALDWDMSLAQGLPIDLEITSAGGQMSLDLRDLLVGELIVESGTSSLEVWVPIKAGEVKAAIALGLGSLVLHVPQGVGARLETEMALSTAELDLTRFVPGEGKGVHISTDYETAPNRIKLDLSLAAGSVRVTSD